MLENEMNKISIAMLLITISSFALADKIYKWVDENGQIHYSSQKPAAQQVEIVKVQKGQKVSEMASEDNQTTQKSTEESAENVDDAAAEAQLAKTDAANMKRLCEQARKNVAALNATVRVSQIDEKTGETIRMNDDQRLQAMKTALQAIKEYCK